MTQTREERINNPFGLKRNGIPWHGLAPVQTDPTLCQFDSVNSGLVAGFKNLHNQWVLHRLNTVNAIIDKYAPPVENDTQAYKSDVCDRLGVGPDDPLNMDDNDVLCKFGKDIIIHENGRCLYDDALLTGAVEDVLG